MATARLNGVCVPSVAPAPQTVGAVSITVAQIDLAAPGICGTIDNVGVHIEGTLIGRNAATGDSVGMKVTRDFTRNAGTLTALGTLANIVAPQGSAALLAALGVLDTSGTIIRLRGTGIAAITLDWTGFLSVWTTDFTG